MEKNPKIVVIIPAFNEENAVGNVVRDIPKELVSEIIVVDNNSSDDTQKSAENEGAIVVSEPQQGYGYACLKGMECAAFYHPDIIVFMDADYSDFPHEMVSIVKPIIEKDFDMVIGSRAIGKREKGSMTIPQVFGNWLATTLIRWIYKAKYTDLGPFRAIKYDKLLELNMRDKTYGWTVEMQLKAAKKGYQFCEVPVTYRKRIGKSKVSGTIKGTLMAGYKILSIVLFGKK